MTEYNAASIDVHEGLQGVRANLNVYLSDLDSNGIFLAFREVVVNSFDEFDDGHGKEIYVVVDKSGYWVSDQARGIPVDIHPKTKKPALTTVLMTLSAGGKMKKEGSGYKKATAGVHGMGISIVNACSSHIQVWSFRKSWYTQTFAKGEERTKLLMTKAPVLPGIEYKPKAGTTVHFRPDMTCFDAGSKLDLGQLRKFLDISSYLHAGLKIRFYVGGKETIYHQPQGLTALLKAQTEGAEATTLSKPFVFNADGVSLALQWLNSDEEKAQTFVNGSLTTQGGTHVNGFNKALVDALEPFSGKRSKYKPEDLRSGLVYFLNAEVFTPKFTNQVKEKLRTPEANQLVYDAVLEPLKEFFNKNKGTAREIVKRANEFAKVSEDAAARKRGVAKLKDSKTRFGVPAKLMASTTKNPEERWLYLVEGDSAGGGAKVARDSHFQEVLPLKGKILNVYGQKKDFGKVFANEEIKSLLQAIGYDKDNPGKFRVGRIIIAGDADLDGFHVSTLALSALHRLAPETIQQGMVYKLDGKLFTCQDKKGRRYYGDTLDEIRKQAGSGIDEKSITRFKGWGEANPDQLVDLMFGPKVPMTKILPSKDEKQNKEYQILVGSDPESVRVHCELIGIEGGQKTIYLDKTVATKETNRSCFRFSVNFNR